MNIKSEMIVKTHLGLNGTADQIVWGCNMQGVFTVKSAYEQALRIRGEGSYRDDKQVFWKKLWSLKLPNTINNFAGRAL